ncbi:alpha/beta hydrolase [Roseateles saccharophilus]|uniref:Alpha-beta hydrolase superfamily lysophospholipase n=1 Tax=Roseateles saccharophilus TaxID=304 RepID=A0A4R3UG97_ROSSA|nr:alpha/beta hydrolase [Roseateles saccharophilus]MDG0834453.1 alpha/beta hydrolase [Roseateles saccharophilus]TCU89835.1 alpha-beta hydrolase superfamily lysophospholipase [Roseateles saccharophilus]
MTTITTDDGLQLQLRHWPAIAEPARGQLLLVHGLGEHIGRYAHVAAALNAQGWDVHGWDHRGHGRSQGRRGDIPDHDALLRDTARVIDAVRQPGRRFVMLGHSMGGLVAARFAAEALAAQPATWSRPLDALVLSSPALDAGLSGLQKLLLAVAGSLAPGLAVGNGLKPEWICRDPAVVQAYTNDPLVHDRITARLTRFIVDGGAQVIAAAPRWTLPTLLMWAGADRCVAPRGSEAFAAAAPRSVVTCRPWPGFAHEIFNEPEKAEVIAALMGWLAR